MIFSSIFYEPIRSTNNLSHGMSSASLAGNLPYLRGFLFLTIITDLYVGTYIVP